VNTSTCNSCRNELPETEFAIKNKATGRRNTKCKPCQRAYAKQHYAANTEAYVTRSGVRNREVKDAYHGVLTPLVEGGTCVCCGVAYGTVVDGKHTRLVYVRKEGYSGAPLHDIIRETRGQAAFDEALKNSELKCDACAFTAYAENLKPMQFGAPGATLNRSHSGRAPYSLLPRASAA
jgi:hypothetical protein